MPRVSSHIALTLAPSTGPPSPAASRSLDGVARELPQLQDRRHSSSFHSAPQRIRHRLVTPHASPTRSLAGGDELMHKRRRRVVEQLAVVDAQHEPPPGGALGQRLTREGEELDALRRAGLR